MSEFVKLNNKTPSVLVMTATITPALNMPGVKRIDSNMRALDYKNAFEFYLNEIPTNLINRIVFLENSGSDLEFLKSVVAKSNSDKKVEFISTNPNYDKSRGKGYGEFLMLDMGLKESQLCDFESCIWKVTGRLKVKNLAEIILKAPEKYGVYCDLRDVPLIGDALGGNQWLELRLTSFTKEAYDRYYRNKYDMGYVLEKEFFKNVYTDFKSSANWIYPRFTVQPEFLGFSGFSNRSYSGFNDRCKGMLRKITRKIMPSLWI